MQPSLVTFVTLVDLSRGIRKSFSVDHAERLLRIPTANGWALPADSPYEFAVATGLRRKPKK